MVDSFGAVDVPPAKDRRSVHTPDVIDRLGVVDGPGAISGLSVGIPDTTYWLGIVNGPEAVHWKKRDIFYSRFG